MMYLILNQMYLI